VLTRSVGGLTGGALAALALWLGVAFWRGARSVAALWQSVGAMWRGQTVLPWRAILLTGSVLALLVGWVSALWPYYHVMGTDQTGNDVLFQAIKSIRTAVVIGSLATLATLPLAIVFGILAGYYKGRVDDGIQYLYTVLSSIPSVLLISAFVLMIQVFIDKNPNLAGRNWRGCCAPRRSSSVNSTTCRRRALLGCQTVASCAGTSCPT